METLLGALVVAFAGLVMGSGAWPYKLMRKYQFEHWWFIGTLVALFVAPWTITLVGCPHLVEGLRSVPLGDLVMANLLSIAWGIANILCGLCFLRIGVALTGAILTGLGVCVGTIAPMVVRGSGQFQGSAGLWSPAGRTLLVGLGVMLIGVVVAMFAGLGRDRQLKRIQVDSKEPAQVSGRITVGLLMAALSGVLSAGMALSFVYSQGPVINALTTRGAGQLAATCAVTSVGLFGGAALNLGYAMYLLTRNKSWHVFTQSSKELALGTIIGINSILGVVLMNKGMLWLGAFGASVGIGIQQCMQMTGNQGLGFISGEWRGVRGAPRNQMYVSIGMLMIAAIIMVYGNSLTNPH